MSYCKDCKHYVVHRTDGPQCTKGKEKPTSPISSCDSFEEAAGSGDAEVQSILARIPDKSVKEEKKPEKKRGGRKKEFENYVDEVTGVTMKYCRTCRLYKPILAFYPKCDTGDGFAYECKECHLGRCKDRQKAKRAREADEIREQAAAAAAPEVERPDEIVDDVEQCAPPVMPDFDAEIDKALYGEAIHREGNDAFLNFNGVFIPIVDWKSGPYGVKPSGLRRLAEHFFNLGIEMGKMK